ncbi:Calx-beta domain-containing protein [Halarcobacter anaerophilus]|uniref:Calx-beta domain-containing protein n=1 Tax=Halarcobacter anaerophilus TaxID=877500 RepID=UPI0005C8F3D6|nr:Calx-beta domain-containing protein [Halarcobacter anaerophilus]
MKLIIRHINGDLEQIDVTNKMEFKPQEGEQYYFLGADKFTFSLADSQQTVRLFLQGEGQRFEITLDNMAELIKNNKPDDIFALNTALGVSSTSDGEKEILDAVNNPDFKSGEIINALKESLSVSSLADNDGSIIDNFGALVDLMEAAAAGDDLISNQSLSIDETSEQDVTPADDTARGERLDTDAGPNLSDPEENPNPEIVINNASLTLNSVSVYEGSGTASITASLSDAPINGPVTFTLSNGSTITFNIGETTSTSTPFPVQGDDIYKDAESYDVSVSSMTGGGEYNDLDTTTISTINIVDTIDTIYAEISVDKASVEEGAELVYTVRLVDENGNEVIVPDGDTVNIQLTWTGEASTGSDTSSLPNSVSITGGTSSTTFIISTTDDAITEDNEPLTATITQVTDLNDIFENVEVSTTNNIANSEIEDDRGSDNPDVDEDITAEVVVGDAGTVEEADGNYLTYDVSLSNAVGSDVTVTLGTSGSATAGDDYGPLEYFNGSSWVEVPTSNEITLPADGSTVQVRVAVIDDAITEDDETVVLSATTSDSQITDSSDTGLGTIEDDRGSDNPDVDEDITAEVVVGDAGTVEEADGNYLTYDVSLSNAVGSDVTVTLGTSGSATAGDDYGPLEYFNGSSWVEVPTSNEITLPADGSTVQVRVAVIDDAITEDDETVVLSATTSDSQITDSSDTGLGTIEDDRGSDNPDVDEDITAEVVVGDAGTVEEADGNYLTYDVSLSNAVGSDVTVTLGTSGSATAGDDYGPLEYFNGSSWVEVPTSNEITLPADGSTVQVRVAVIDDAITEDDETVVLSATTSDSQITDSSDTGLGTIEDDRGSDNPDVDEDITAEVVVGDAGTVEEADGNYLTYDVSLSNAVGSDVTVTLGTSGSATAGDDYGPLEYFNGSSWVEVPTSNEITLPADGSTVQVRVAVIDDAITEDDETVVLSATTSDSQITDSSDTGLGTIEDDRGSDNPDVDEDITAEVVVGDAGTVEEADGNYLTYDVSLSNAVGSDVTVTLGTSGSATAGDDYGPLEYFNGSSWVEVPTSNEITLPADGSTVQVRVAVIDDAITEDDETVVLSATTSDSQITDSSDTGLGTIEDDRGSDNPDVDEDITAEVVVGDAGTVEEADGNYLTYDVSLSNAVGSDVTVTLGTSGSATAGDDYGPLEYFNGSSWVEVPTSNEITLPADGSTVQVRVAVIDDAITEDDETVVLSATTSDSQITDSSDTGLGTIEDDRGSDNPDVDEDITAEVVVGDAGTVEEADGNYLTYDVSLSNAVGSDVTVTLGTSGSATAGDDYGPLEYFNGSSWVEVPTSNEITLPADGSTVQVRVAVIDDAITEDDETVVLSATTSDSQITDSSDTGLGTIEDDRGSDNPDVDEDITAEVVVGDAGTVEEADGNYLTYDVSLSNAVGSDVTVTLGTSGSATAGDDYGPLEYFNGSSWVEVPTSNEITLPADGSTVQVRVAVIDDAITEDDETVVLSATTSDSQITDSSDTGLGTIEDDRGSDNPDVDEDITAEVVVGDAGTVEEADGNYLTYDVSLSNAVGSDVTVTLGTSGSATAGDDYGPLEYFNGSSWVEVPTSNEITLPADGSTVQVRVAVIDDAITEDDETVVLSATTSDSQITDSSDTGLGTIEDDRGSDNPDVDEDITAEVVVGDAGTVEEADGNYLTYDVSLSNAVGSDVTVTLGTSGSATAGDDYGPLEYFNGSSWVEVPTSNEITLPADGSTVQVRVAVIDDAITEDDETVVLSATTSDSQITDSSDTGLGTIEDDRGSDNPDVDEDITAEVVVGDAGTVEEADGNYLTYDVSLSNAVGSDVTVTLGTSGSATAGDDYGPLEYFNGSSWVEVPTSNEITLPADGSTVQVRVAVIDDAITEDDETVVLSATTSDSQITDSSDTGLGTIEDDRGSDNPDVDEDITAEVVVGDAGTVEEADGNYLTYDVSLSNAVGSDVTVTLGTSGSATAGDDYGPLEYFNGSSWVEVPTSNEITLPADGSTVQVRVAVIDDAITEDDETVVLSATTSDSQITDSSDTGLGTIEDDRGSDNPDVDEDITAEVVVGDAGTVEEADGNYLTYDVSLSNAVGSDVTVTLGTSGSATAGDDYGPLEYFNGSSWVEVPTSNEITLPADGSTVQVRVAVIDDAITEDDETVVLSATTSDSQITDSSDTGLGTIEDDRGSDNPDVDEDITAEVVVGDAGTVEEADGNYLTYDVSLSNAVGSDVTVTLGTSGSATAGDDYGPLEYFNGSSWVEVPTSNEITLPADGSTVQVRVAVIDDAITEDDETVVLSATTSDSQITDSSDTGLGTIEDDRGSDNPDVDEDITAEVVVGDAGTVEEADGNYLTYDVSLSNAVGSDVTVTLGTSGSATAGDDYGPLEYFNGSSWVEVPTSNEITLPADGSTVQVRVAVIDDAITEDDETVVLSATTSDSQITDSSDTGLGTIEDDRGSDNPDVDEDITAEVVVGDAGTVEEADGNYLTYDVSLSNAVGSDVTVTLGTSGSATAGDDYGPLEYFNGSSWVEVPTSNEITLPADGSTVQVRVAVIDDAITEDDETVVLSATTSDSQITDSSDTGLGTIEDDRGSDNPDVDEDITAEVVVGDAGTVEEADGNYLTYDVSLSNAVGSDVTVTLGTSGSATAGDDYGPLEYFNGSSWVEVPTSNEITLPADGSTVQVRVAVIDDAITEDDETVVLSATTSDSQITDSSDTGLGTIEDDRGSDNPDVDEDITAEVVVGDAGTVEEADGNYLTYDVSLSNAVGSDVTVTLGTSGSATAGDDYGPLEYFNGSSWVEVPTSNEITLPADGSTVQVRVAVIDDAITEDDETVVLSATTSDSQITDSSDTGLGTIEDDRGSDNPDVDEDITAEVVVGDAGTVEEADGNYLTYDVSLSNAVGSDVTVTLGTSGSATAGDDYGPLEYFNGSSWVEVPTSNEITLPADGSTVQVRVAVIDDAITEDDETVVLSATTSDSQITDSSDTGLGTIEDDRGSDNPDVDEDITAEVVVGDAGTVEEADGNYLTYDVSLSNAVGSDVTVTLGTSGSATAGDDYGPLEYFNGSSWVEVPTSNEITLPADGSTVQVRVAVIDDAITEDDETVVLSATTSDSQITDSSDTGLGTIEDDRGSDNPDVDEDITAEVVVGDAGTVEEADGNYLTYDVSLSNAVGSDVTVTLGTSGSATAGDDYGPLEYFNGSSWVEVPTSNEITLPADGSTVQVRVAVIDDAITEDDETVVLSATTSDSQITDSSDTGLGTIEDDRGSDNPDVDEDITAEVVVGDAGTVEEADGNYLTYDVSLSNAVGSDVTVTLGTSGSATAGDDYGPLEYFNGSSWVEVPTSNEITLPADGSTVQVRVAVIDDAITEDDETVVLSATTSDSQITDSSDTGLGTIEDDRGSDNPDVDEDITAEVVVGDAGTVEEADGNYLTYDVSLSNAVGSDVTVTLGTSGSATAGDDYGPLEYFNGSSWVEVPTSNEITLPADGSTVQVRVAVIDDAITEDDETVVLSATTSDSQITDSSDTGLGTIEDDRGSDNPDVDEDITAEVVVGDAGTVEEADGNYLTYDVSLSNAVGSDVTVTLGTSGSATAGDDYGPLEYFNGSSWVEVPTSNEITLPADGSTVQVRVAVIDDAITEDDETVVLSATTSDSQITDSSDTGLGTIEDDRGSDNPDVDEDITAEVVVGDAGTVEEADGNYLTYDVSLSNAVGSDVTVTLGTSGSATAGDDYGPLEYFNGSSWVEVPTSNEITLPADGSTVQVRVAVIDDAITEDDETVVLSATTSDSQITDSSDTGLGTIEDDRGSDNPDVDEDITAEVVVGDAGTVEEADGNYLTYDVSLSNAVGSDVTVTLGTSGSATAGDDYGPLEYFNGSSWVEVPTSNEITLPADGSTVQVRVAVIDDAITEDDETVVLSATTSDSQITDSSDTGLGTIEDDRGSDNPDVDEDITAEVVVGDAGTVEEADGNYLTYDVSLSNAVGSDVTVTLGTSGSATAGDDYGPLEYFNGSSWVEVPTSNEITLPADGSTVQVRVAVIDDAITEDDETVVLSATTSDSQITDSSDTGLGTIEDDRGSDNPDVDEDITAEVVVGDAGTVEEADGNYLTYDVSLSNAVGSDVTVTLGTSGSATAGDDYGPLEYFNGSSWVEVPTSNEITLPADGSTVQVRVAVIDDAITEDDETVVLSATTSDSQITDSSDTGLGTIEDDRGSDNPDVDEDITAEVVVGDAGTVEEADGNYLTYDVSLSNAVGSDVTVTLGTSGSATAGDDYGPLEYFNGSSWVEVPTSNEITLPADGSTVQVRVAVIDDAITEDDETVVLSATTSDSQITDSSDTGLGTIEDDRGSDNPDVDEDITAEVVVGDAGTVEEADGNYLTYDVSLSNAVGSDVTVTLGTSGSATAGDDYGPLEYFNGSSWVEVPTSNEITLPADGSTVQVRVAVIDDAITEDDETVVLSATTSDSQITDSSDTGLGTIEDDQDETIITLKAPEDVDENSTKVTYTLEVSNPPQGDLDVTVEVNGEEIHITIPDGQTSTTFDVDVREDDPYLEENDTISAEIVDHNGGNYEAVSYNNDDNEVIIKDDADVTDVSLSATITKTTTIDVTNVGEEGSYTIKAYDLNGNEVSVSKNYDPNHSGFGVSSNTSNEGGSAADSELGSVYSHGEWKSEKLVVDFGDKELLSIDISFAWKNSNEKAVINFYKDGVKVGETIYDHGGSDTIDDVLTFRPSNGEPFDSIEFSAAINDNYTDHDYLIHNIAYKEVISDSTEITDDTEEVTFTIQTSNVPDPSKYDYINTFPTATVEVEDGSGNVSTYT